VLLNPAAGEAIFYLLPGCAAQFVFRRLRLPEKPCRLQSFQEIWCMHGTINQSGILEIGAQTLGWDTSFGRIVEAVEHAEKARPPMQKTADRLAGYLVYFTLAAAILTFLITRDVRSTISVVIVAGACGIAAGTPLAILGAMGRAGRQGAIIKGGLYLEALATIDTVLLDKTGTLTFGTPQIREVIPNDGFASNEIIAAATIAERRSEHPLAKAILARANELGMPIAEPDSFSYTPGRGIRVTYQGDEILVGRRAFLGARGLGRELPTNGQSRGGASEIFVARQRKVLGYPHCRCATS
jgi:P-type E1-E2 ATPase